MNAQEKTPFLIFAIDDDKYAFDLNLVEQVYPAVEVTPLPNAPDTVLGLINVHGAIIVVLDVRRKLKLRERLIELSDQLLIANINDRQLALLVDEVVEIMHFKRGAADDEKSRDFDACADSLRIRTIETETGSLPVFDLENFLTTDEENNLRTALQQAHTYQ